MRKRDFIFIFFIIITAFGLLLINTITSKKGDTVVIYKDSKIYKSIPVSQDAKVDVDGENIVTINNGIVYMESATCPDKLCIKQGKINDSSRDIVCLPNSVTVKIKKKNNEVDAVSR